MAKAGRPQRGFRTMTQEDIFKLNSTDCVRGIRTCRTARSYANRLNRQDEVDGIDIQIGAFDIQMDMIAAGDIKEVK